MEHINFDEVVESSNDYSMIVMENQLTLQKYFHQLDYCQLVMEANWLTSCLETSMIQPILEADKIDFKQKFRDLAAKIKEIILELIDKIKHDAVERSKMYSPWVKEYGDKIIAAIPQMGDGISIAPLQNGTWDKDSDTIASAIRDGLSLMEDKKYDDYSYAKDFTDPENVSNKNANLDNFLRNYFRFNLKDTLEVKTVTLDQTQLKKIVPEMIEYISNFSGNIEPAIKKIQSAYDTTRITRASQNDTKVPATDSYLQIEGCCVSESILTSMINYSSVFEADNNTNDNNNKEEDKKEIAITNSDGEKVSVTKAEQVNPETNDTDKKTQTDDAKMTSYINILNNFIQKLITTYSAACDERFLVYLNSLSTIAKKDKEIPSPQEYIKEHNLAPEDKNKDNKDENNK